MILAHLVLAGIQNLIFTEVLLSWSQTLEMLPQSLQDWGLLGTELGTEHGICKEEGLKWC